MLDRIREPNAGVKPPSRGVELTAFSLLLEDVGVSSTSRRNWVLFMIVFDDWRSGHTINVSHNSRLGASFPSEHLSVDRYPRGCYDLMSEVARPVEFLRLLLEPRQLSGTGRKSLQGDLELALPRFNCLCFESSPSEYPHQ